MKASKVAGQLVVITGSSTEPRVALAAEYVRAGAHTIIVARYYEKLDAATASLEAHRRDANQIITSVAADCRDPASIREAVLQHGVPNILIACADWSLPRLFVESTPDDFRQQMSDNYFATINAVHPVFSEMLKRSRMTKLVNRTRIVIVSFTAACYGITGYSACAPSQAALQSLVDHLRQETLLYPTLRDSLRIHCVCPSTFSPSFLDEEQIIIKPDITTLLEEDDKGWTPAQVAINFMKAITKESLLISTGLRDSFEGAMMQGSSPSNSITPWNRTESKRAKLGGAGSSSKAGGGRAPSDKTERINQVGASAIVPENDTPLATPGSKSTPKRAAEAEPLSGTAVNTMAPDLVQQKVKGLLNKLTLDSFDTITEQILKIASQSKDENDGRTLRQIIALTYEKATDDAHFSSMCARLCRKLMECTSDEFRNEKIVDKHGNPVVGGTLFRKYLLSRCQEDFERGWKTELAPNPDDDPQSEEAAMLSDEYSIVAPAKRPGPGLVKFIGELFLVEMLNEKIMQECIKKLSANVTDPEDEHVESLTILLQTVGSALDSNSRRQQIMDVYRQQIMDVYMQRMEQLSTCKSLSSRIKSMVLDVIDLRKNHWSGSKTDICQK